MSKKKLAGIIVGCIIVVISIVAPAIPKPVTDYGTLLLYLRGSGASIGEKVRIGSSCFPDAKGRRVKVNGSIIEVYEYENAEAMEWAASRVSPDGLSIRSDCPRDSLCITRIMRFDWIDTPHFYKAGRIIVIYIGDNTSTIRLLRNGLGKQFAGM